MYNGNDEEVLLDSEVAFFDVFTMRSLKRSDIRIPNTLICEDGLNFVMQGSGKSGCSTPKGIRAISYSGSISRIS
jgi:hypothetical protein